MNFSVCLAIIAAFAALTSPYLMAQGSAMLAKPMAGRIPATLAEASLAWDGGDYSLALRGFERLLTGPSAAAAHEPIALITGELYRTTELTRDGRAPRLHPRGAWVAHESGSGATAWTHLRALDASVKRDSLRGFGLAFSPTGDQIAVLRVRDTPELAELRAELQRGAQAADAARVVATQRRLTELQSRQTSIVLRDLQGGQEREFADSALAVASLTFAPDGNAVMFIGKRPGENGTQLFSFSPSDRQLTSLTSGDTSRADLALLPGGKALVYTVGRDPFGLPVPGAPGVRGLVVRDVASGRERSFAGVQPTASADGSVIAWLERRGPESLIQVLPLNGSTEPATIKKTTERVDSPAISPDGRTVAFQMMPREDWEIFLVGTDGRNERRLTREIQHDLFPRWLSNDRLLAVMGEARHRRAHVYEAATGARSRLFHNNTVRTISPEYEWLVSADGSKVAIVAERDGDTVSPERGVYVVDLTQKVAADELLRRVRANLAAEVALRDRTERMFAPIAAQVRRATDSVSMDRLYRYQRDLFAFDSKHITRPGNALAIDYLRDTYASFGYEPTLQWFEPRGIRTANIVATLKGTVSPDVVYVVGSHFDSVTEGAGADDNTSGTSMLLETARLLAKHPLPATVQFVSFTGEEGGLLGSREFVRRLKADSVRLAGAINNDMMGWSNDQRLDNTIRYSNAGIRDVQHGAALHFSKLITYDALYYKSTDAAAFYDAYGDIVGGFGSYPVLGNPHYNQRHDVLETINQELVAENTRANVATIMHLASAPSRLSGLKATRSGNAVSLTWTASPEKDVRGYIVSWTPSSGGAVRTIRTAVPNVRLADVRPGTTLMVKAVNSRGLEGWDWARVQGPLTVAESGPAI